MTNEVIDVAGRVGDLLSGFMGLTVLVNGVQAVVDVGIGTNGTFLAPSVPLVVGPNVITAVAIDALGNKITKVIMVTRVEIPPDAPRMHVTSANEQIGQVGSLLGQPIVVQVTHPDGEPFVNKLVTFDVTRSNGRLSADVMGEGATMLQLFTDAVGEARAFWRVGFDAGCGNNRVEVTSGDVVGTTFFGASATPAPAAQINVGSGNNQRAETGAPAPEPLRVWVSDACNGVSGIPVTFSVTLGDGKVNGQNEATVPTTATGHAEVAFTMGSNPGNNLVEATFPTNSRLPARFVAFGLARDVAQQTSFIGTVLNNAEQPVQGATCSLNAGGVPLPSTQTDINGMFQFDDIPSSGPADLFIDGASAFHVGGEGGTDIPLGSFPALHYTPLLIPNAVNALSTPVLLPPLNPANALVFDNTQDVVLTVVGIDGLRMMVKAGSMTSADGTVPSPADPAILSLNQVHYDDVPMPMPDGAAPPFAWTLQPGGATFDPPIAITYPNMSGLPAGSIAYFLSFNHDTMRFEIVASGAVTDDGQCIVTDPGVGITVAGWGCNCPPYSVSGECCSCGDVGAGSCCGGVCCEGPCCDGSCCDGNCCAAGGSCCNGVCCEGDCCDGMCCGAGEVCCGGECWPEPCTCCESGTCCPEALSTCCGDSCCPDSFSCCNHSCCEGDCCNGICCDARQTCCGDVCCGAGETCCNGNECCNAGQACCDEGCCAFDDGICCGVGGCCPAGGTCCGLDNCCAPEETCCGETCCTAGQTCCDGQCCDSAEECCNGNQCCPTDQACCADGCCLFVDGVCCGDGCCPPGATCCGNGSCCAAVVPICCGEVCGGEGLQCCGGTFCCSDTATCCGINTCCGPTQTCCNGNQCCPAGAPCCDSGCCQVGQACVDGECVGP